MVLATSAKELDIFRHSLVSRYCRYGAVLLGGCYSHCYTPTSVQSSPHASTVLLLVLMLFRPATAHDSFLPIAAATQTSNAAPLILVEDKGGFPGKRALLVAWFLLNLTLTMCNKAILAKANLPWLLTTFQLSVTALGCFGLVGYGTLEPAKLKRREEMILTAFSLLFTLNIAISNVSLGIVSVPLHQLLRSTCPAFTLLFYGVLGRSYSVSTYASILVLIIGVALATLGDYYCTFLGFAATLLGVVLAASKTIATNLIMTGPFKLPALEVLLLMTPLATVQCVFCTFMSGEVERAHGAFVDGHLGLPFILLLLANGVMAFLLNIVSLQTNKAAGAVTMTVAGNIKQVVTVLLGIVLFHIEMNMLSVFGIAITTIGAAWYSKLDLDARHIQA